MKIIMIHPHDLFSHKEPWTIRIKAIASELRKLGHEITVVTFTLDSFPQKPFNMEGINYICLSRKISLLYFFKKIFFFKKLFKDYDIIYFQKCFHFAAIPSIFAAFLNKKWLHYDWDDNETAIFFSGKKTPSYIIGFLLMLLEKIIPKIATTISVSSDYLFNKALKLGVQKQNIIKIPVGAYQKNSDDEKITIIKKKYNLTPPSFVYIGQLHGGQYVENLLKAAKQLKKENLKFKILIIGSGHDKNRLEQIKDKDNLNNHVIFTSHVPHNDIFQYLKACDIAIACFDKNKITQAKSPLKIAEYLGAKKIIIASKVGEIPFMLNNTGILIDPNNKNSLFEAMKNLIKKPAKIDELQNIINNTPFTLTWGNSAKKLNVFFEHQTKQTNTC